MISKRCTHCGKRIQVGKDCGCISKKRYKPTASDKYTADVKEFYRTKEWEHARDECIRRCHGIDIYSLFVLGKIEYGFTVHHIVPLIDDYSLRKSQSNLIYLTESNHRHIHKLYETDYESATALLKSLLQRFEDLKKG